MVLVPKAAHKSAGEISSGRDYSDTGQSN